MKQDVIIIGGSFAGLSAAMQLARGQRQVTVIDAAQPRNRFAEHSHGFLGLDGSSPAEIRAKAIEQLSAYDSVSLINGMASSAHKDGQDFVVALENGEHISGKKLIIATGVKDELPAIPGLDERWGKTVAHCPYCHGHEVRHLELGVIATSPLSGHQAGMLTDWGTTTYFTQGLFMPDDAERDFLLKRGVKIENTPVIEVLGKSPEIEALKLADGRIIKIGAVFIGSKTQMSSPLAEELGCEWVDGPMGKIIKTDDFKQTNIEGVYACGDISNPMQNATFASASGVMAGVAAHQALIKACR